MKQPERRRVPHKSKVYEVAIAEMRVPPALLTQREFRPGWGNFLAAHLDLDLLGFPVLNHRDGVFWVLDGQHRIFALKERGFGDASILCEVYEDLSDADMARFFLGRVGRAPRAFDRFHIACTADYPREVAVRRAIESQGLKISGRKEERCVSAVAACCRVYDRAGDVVLGRALRMLKNAFGGDPASFDGVLIEGAGAVFARYNGRIDERGLASRLAETPLGVRGVLQRAESLRARTGNQKVQCVAAVMVDLYNQGLRGAERLVSWWKSAEDDESESRGLVSVR